MNSKEITTRKQAEELLVRKASEDKAFRQELLANPKATIAKEFGIQFEGNLKINVLEESVNNFFLVLPLPPATSGTGELAERELDAVAGGTISIGGRTGKGKGQPSLPINPVSTPGL